MFSAPFLDADDYHSEASIQKLSHGIPLTDDDRAPWLVRVAEAMAKAARDSPSHMCFMACSALKREYRDVLRAIPGVRVAHLYLRLAPEVLLERLERRQNHFMKSALLHSQLVTLEEPVTGQEPDVATLEIQRGEGPDDVLQEAARYVETLRPLRA